MTLCTQLLAPGIFMNNMNPLETHLALYLIAPSGLIFSFNIHLVVISFLFSCRTTCCLSFFLKTFLLRSSLALHSRWLVSKALSLVQRKLLQMSVVLQGQMSLLNIAAIASLSSSGSHLVLF
jgi:hypothetical protein